MRLPKLALLISSLLLGPDVFSQCTLSDTTLSIYVTSVTISSMPSLLSGVGIEIDTDFDIDADVTWDNCQVLAETGISIVVKAGFELSILNGSLVTTKAFWHGIDVEPGGKLTLNGSVICGADDAIESLNAGSSTPAEYDIQNSFLLRNINGLVVSNFNAAAHPGILRGTTISGPDNLIGTNSQRGILVTDVGTGATGLTIGGGSTNNLIEDFPIGIDIDESTVSIRQTDFDNIQPSVSPLNGTAIRAITLVPNELNVGGGTAFACTFRNCKYGIDVSGYETVNINDNTFTSTAVGLQVVPVNVRFTSNTLNVGDNIVDRYTNVAIDLDQNNLSMMRVRDNEITGNLGSTRGINVDEHTGELDIKFNIVSDVYRGIITQSVSLGAFTGVIDDNEIGFEYSGSGPPAIGILVAESDYVLILGNDITGNCASGTCTDIRGIQQWESTDVAIFENSVYDCGGGAFVRGNSAGSQIFCNLFENVHSAIVFDDINPGEYGEFVSSTLYKMIGIPSGSSVPTDNQFVAYTNNIFQTGSGILSNTTIQTDLYYRNTPSQYDYTSIVTIILASEPDLVLSPIGAPCAPSLRMGADSSLVEHADVVDSLLLLADPSLIPVYIYEHLQRVVRNNDLGNDINTTRLIDLTNLVLIQDLIESTTLDSIEIDGLLSTISAIIPVNETESFYKNVLAIRANAMKRVMNGSMVADVLTPSEYGYLDSIVYELPFERTLGSSILAQSVLGITYIPDGWVIAEEPKQAQSIGRSLAVFPNPGEDFVSVSNIPQDASELMVVSILGEVVMRTPIQTNTTTLNLKGLASGLYIVVTDSPSETSSVKLIRR